MKITIMRKVSLLVCIAFLFTILSSTIFALNPSNTELDESVLTQENEPADEEETQPADEEETQPADEEETQPADEEETQPADEEETQPADEEQAQLVDKETELVQTTSNQSLRREISSDNPLFIYNIYKGQQGPQNIEALWNVIPDDLKPYFGIQIKADSPFNNTKDNTDWMESMLDKAQELGVPTFIQTETMNTNSNIPQSYYASLFDQYSVLTGLIFAELSASGITVFGITSAQVENIKQTIDTVSSKGGYFMWQDMGYEIQHLFMKAGADSSLYEKIIQHGDNVILVEKHNGRNKRFVGPAAAMGFWASDLIGNWGVNSEDWLWWEAGYGHLYQPVGSNRSQDDWKAVFSFPDAQFGIDWLVDMAGGATVYSLECPYHGFTSMNSEELTPAFNNVLIPLIRKMVNESIIPTREQVMEKIKVAHYPQSGNPDEVQNDELFVDLYGPEGEPLHEWIPSTGRYAYLPILPKLSGEEQLNKYEALTNSDNYDGLFPSHYDKTKRFNQDYDAIGEGDSWFMSYDNNHFIVNPNENKNVDTNFEFPLQNKPEASISGVISPHTLSIIQERADGMDIHLSNYRIDSEADVWNNSYINADDIAGYVKNTYIDNPTDDTLRQSVVVLKGMSSQEPTLTVTGDNGYNYTTNWDNNLNELTITVNHNGPVDINIESSMDGVGTTNRNLAPYAHISSSSRYDDKFYIDEKAIDGVDTTRWNASPNNKTGAWLELTFDTYVTVDKLVLKEFENRVSDYKFQYFNGIEWIDIFTDTTIGQNKVKNFEPVTSNRYRVYITSVNGNEASIYEVELYNTASPTIIPTAGENLALNKSYSASSCYDNNNARVQMAFDETSMTSWNAASGTTGGQWLEVDFMEETTFNKVITKTMLDRITGYKLQYWDGTSWNDILFGSKIYPQKCDVFAPITAQKFRIYINSTKDDQVGWGSDAEIDELGVYFDESITDIPKNLALNKVASASSSYENNSSLIPFGIDANLSTAWNAAKNTSSGQWYEVDFLEDTTFNRIDLYAYLDRITGYKLQYYNGSDWVDIMTGNSITPYKSNKFSPVTAQKVRIYITSCKKDQYGWGIDPEIDEFLVYMQP